VFEGIEAAYSGEPLWIAQPGERYRVLQLEPGFALTVFEVETAEPVDNPPVWFHTEANPMGIQGLQVCG